MNLVPNHIVHRGEGRNQEEVLISTAIWRSASAKAPSVWTPRSEPAFLSLKPSPEQLSQTRKAKLEIGLIKCVQFGEQALRFRILAHSLLVFLQSLLL